MVQPFESENGWRPRHAPADLLEWITVPGTDPRVTLQLMKGWPTTILRAFAADFNAYVEHLRDPDSAAFTPTNKVDTSNHLNGTAMDLNWNGADGKTFRLGISEAVAYPGEKAKNLRDLLDFYEGMVFCGGNWDIRDWMHFQMGGNTWNNPKTGDFILRKIRLDGYSTYRRGVVIPPAPPPSTSYGLPTGSRINYGAPGFPAWVYDLAGKFGLRASTYPGHQENDRIEAGYERNSAHLNRGIDWAGPVDKMQAYADYLLNIRTSLEQVIWQNPNTGQRIGVAGGKDVSSTGYYASDYGGHRDHVHTRQSKPIPVPGVPAPPPAPPPSNAADVLARAAGIPLARAQAILPQVSFALRKANCTNPRRIAAALAQWIIESGHFVYTEEIADGPESQERWKYKGRTWIQLTWLENYKGFSEWCHSLNLVPTPDYFVVRPRELAEQKWAALGPAYWWAIKYPRINEYADRGDIDNVSKWVNAPAWVDNPNKHANHEAERRAAYNKALALGDQLLVLIAAGPPPPPPGEDDFLSALSAEEQREVLAAARNQLAQRKSRSPLRELDEGTVGDTDDQIWDMDSSIHILVVYLMAMLGHPGQLALLNRVASADPARYPDRQPDRMVAQAILAEVADNQEMKRDILEALGRVATAAPEVLTGQVMLPAVIQGAEPAQSMNTPQDLLDTIERLKVFDNDYRDKFDDLTKGKK